MGIELQITADELRSLRVAMAEFFPIMLYPDIWNALVSATERVEAGAKPPPLRLSEDNARLLLGWLYRCYWRQATSSSAADKAIADPFRRIGEDLYDILQGSR